MGLFQFSGQPAGQVTSTGSKVVGQQLRQPAFSQLTGTLGGDYLYGGDAFNAAQQAAYNQITPQVQSAFSGGGRLNSGLAQVAQTQALGDSFAGLYNNERNRQLQAAQIAPSLTQDVESNEPYFENDLATLAGLLGVGSSLLGGEGGGLLGSIASGGKSLYDTLFGAAAPAGSAAGGMLMNGDFDLTGGGSSLTGAPASPIGNPTGSASGGMTSVPTSPVTNAISGSTIPGATGGMTLPGGFGLSGSLAGAPSLSSIGALGGTGTASGGMTLPGAFSFGGSGAGTGAASASGAAAPSGSGLGGLSANALGFAAPAAIAAVAASAFAGKKSQREAMIKVRDQFRASIPETRNGPNGGYLADTPIGQFELKQRYPNTETGEINAIDPAGFTWETIDGGTLMVGEGAKFYYMDPAKRQEIIKATKSRREFLEAEKDGRGR